MAFSKKLKEAGADDGLAEAIVEGITEGLAAADTSDLATKGDLTEVRASFADLKAELLKWMFIIMFAVAGIIVAAIKLL